MRILFANRTATLSYQLRKFDCFNLALMERKFIINYLILQIDITNISAAKVASACWKIAYLAFLRITVYLQLF
jgi:hypothetical protein